MARNARVQTLREISSRLSAAFGIGQGFRRRRSHRQHKRRTPREGPRGNGGDRRVRRHRGRPPGTAQEESFTLAAKHGRVNSSGGLPKSNPFISFSSNLIHYKELFMMGTSGIALRNPGVIVADHAHAAQAALLQAQQKLFHLVRSPDWPSPPPARNAGPPSRSRWPPALSGWPITPSSRIFS